MGGENKMKGAIAKGCVGMGVWWRLGKIPFCAFMGEWPAFRRSICGEARVVVYSDVMRY